MSLSQTQIKEILPHRSPLLLLDSVSELIPGMSIVSSVTINPKWDIFSGHFPDYPVLPGIYITECMSQAAALMLLSIPERNGKLPLLFQLQQIRFLHSVFPGDVMELKASLKCELGNEMYDCKVSSYVNGKKIAYGIVTMVLK